MHLVLSVQDTRPRSAAVLPCGEAIVCSAQLVPFQRSARPVPVAVHAAAAVQDTPSSWLTVLAVLGVLWMAQPDPFQTSARVAESGPVNESPTASQAVAAGQETPPSALFAAPLTFGVDWMVQEPPFQASARVLVAPPLVNCPTASHDDADLHETSLSWLAVAPLGLGVLWTDQVPPFQTSARVSMVPPLLKLPTASHDGRGLARDAGELAGPGIGDVDHRPGAAAEALGEQAGGVPHGHAGSRGRAGHRGEIPHRRPGGHRRALLQPARRSWLRYHQNGGRHQRRRYHKPFHLCRYSPEFSLFKAADHHAPAPNARMARVRLAWVKYSCHDLGVILTFPGVLTEKPRRIRERLIGGRCDRGQELQSNLGERGRSRGGADER